jgi:hypothetical protein
LAGAACCGFGAEARDAGRSAARAGWLLLALLLSLLLRWVISRDSACLKASLAAGAEADIGFLRGHCIGVQGRNLEVWVCMFRAL